MISAYKQFVISHYTKFAAIVGVITVLLAIATPEGTFTKNDWLSSGYDNLTSSFPLSRIESLSLRSPNPDGTRAYLLFLYIVAAPIWLMTATYCKTCKIESIFTTASGRNVVFSRRRFYVAFFFILGLATAVGALFGPIGPRLIDGSISAVTLLSVTLRALSLFSAGMMFGFLSVVYSLKRDSHGAIYIG